MKTGWCAHTPAPLPATGIMLSITFGLFVHLRRLVLDYQMYFYAIKCCEKVLPAIKVVEKLNVKSYAVTFTYVASGLHERSLVCVCILQCVCVCVVVHFKLIHLYICVCVCVYYPVYSHLFIITYAYACSGHIRKVHYGIFILRLRI